MTTDKIYYELTYLTGGIESIHEKIDELTTKLDSVLDKRISTEFKLLANGVEAHYGTLKFEGEASDDTQANLRASILSIHDAYGKVRTLTNQLDLGNTTDNTIHGGKNENILGGIITIPSTNHNDNKIHGGKSSNLSGSYGTIGGM